MKEKTFMFLESSEFFSKKIKNDLVDVEAWFYKEENKDKSNFGRIIVSKKSMKWEFMSRKRNVEMRFEKIETTPEWFQELYRKASKKYDELTRVRKLFEMEGDE